MDRKGIVYYADVPANTQVYLQQPEIGIPEKASPKGRPVSQPQVLNSVPSHRVELVAKNSDTQWKRLFIRQNERGVLEDDFTARLVWTWKKGVDAAREEWLIIRIERNGDHTYLFSNAPEEASLQSLAEGSCGRSFIERAIQDAKGELGWDEFQAQKYQGWAHHTALTACALWFIADTKLDWAEEAARDPQLAQQLEIEVLPALSTAKVRELLKSVFPLLQLSSEEACPTGCQSSRQPLAFYRQSFTSPSS